MISRAAAFSRVAASHAKKTLSLAGQPTHETHPELLSENEIQPGITAAEFADRRRRLASLLPPGSLCLVPAAPQQFMTGVIPYPYRQDADFMYLTGISQPQSVAVIDSEGTFTLFVPNKDSWREQWDGVKLEAGAAINVFGADEAYPLADIRSKLSSRLSSSKSVFYDPDRPVDSTDVREMLHGASSSPPRCHRLRPLVHDLRWKKSSSELALMRKSSSIAASAMMECMKASSGENVSEHTLAALFEYTCKVAGAHRMAYPPVVAGGEDSCTIHYSRNDKTVAAGSFLKLDGGCELFGYCSDVTRTWPVGGRWSAPQRELYHIVLDTHRACIEACKPGSTLRNIHQMSARLLADGLRQIGLFQSQEGLCSIDRSELLRRLYPHSVGHWLGIDTHDSSTVSHDRPLEPGVVLTIEPGLYIPNEPETFGHFAGLGIRIEDVVAIDECGARVLSSHVPIDIENIERIICKQ